MQLKPIHEQIMVLTGASSGMGLVIARRAAECGARLVLVARDETSLTDLVSELESKGGEAVAVVADVTQQEAVERVATRAVERFGGFDTWVNIAGLTTYGTIEEVAVEDHRRLFETNYWSVFYGSLAAAKHLRQHGGAIINAGSILSDMTVPFQGTYCATKHAVKAFTNALRMELERDDAPVSVSLIKPSSIDTPLRHHGKNYMENEPQNPPPAYAPELMADAVIYCAQHRKRDVVVGGGGRLITLVFNHAPRLTELFMERVMHRMETTDNRAGPLRRNSLFSPLRDGKERGGTPPFEHSLYTRAQLNPGKTAAIGLGACALVLSLLGSRSLRKRRRARHW